MHECICLWSIFYCLCFHILVCLFFFYLINFFNIPIGFLMREQESVGICVAGEVRRILDKFGERKTLIRVYYMKYMDIFSISKERRKKCLSTLNLTYLRIHNAFPAMEDLTDQCCLHISLNYQLEIIF